MMRKVLKFAAIGLSALMLVGCGGKEQSVKLTTESSGANIEMVLDAKGDTVHTMTQTSTVDISALGEEYLDMIQGKVEEAKASFDGIKGAEYTSETTDSELKEVITIDMTDADSLKELSSAGLPPIEGTTSKISLKKTKENLVSQGWKVVE